MRMLAVSSSDNFISRLINSSILLALVLGFPLSAMATSVGCDDAFVDLDVNSLVINVATTGVNDTANIQCALDVAASDGYPIVRLAADTFFIGGLRVEDFKGTLEGKTKISTIIEVLDQSIDCDRMLNEDMTHSVIKFVKGEPRIRFMTIRAHRPCINMGQQIYTLLHFTGEKVYSSCDADVIFGAVDRVILDGTVISQGPRNAVLVAPEGEYFPTNCKHTLLGTFKLNRSEVHHTSTGILTSMKSGAQVDINFNKFQDNQKAVLLNNTNQNTTITSNEFSSNAPAFSYIGVSISSRKSDAPTSTRAVIHNNTFNMESSGDTGFAVLSEQDGHVVNMSVVATNNRFNLLGINSYGFSFQNTSNGHLSANQFSGSGARAIYITGDTQVTGWTITANKGLGTFESERGHDIRLRTLTSECIVGAGQGATVRDNGTNNTVLPQ